MNEHTLLRLLRFRTRLFVLTLLAWIAYSCIPLAGGALTQAVFNSLTGDRPARLDTWTLLGLLLLVEVLATVLGVGWFALHQTFEPTLIALLRRNLFSWILGNAAVSAVPLSTGEAISRFRDDIDPAVTPINEWYRLAGDALFALIALIVMLSIDPLITLAGVVPLGAIVVLVHRLRTRMQAYRAAAQEAGGRVNGFLGELLGTVQAVKVAGAERAVIGRFTSLNDVRRRATLRDVLLASLLDSFGWNLATLSRGVILLLSAGAIRAGTFSVGDFALFVTYIEFMMDTPRRIGRLLASRRLSAVSTQRLLELTPGQGAATLVQHNPVFLDTPAPPLAHRAPAAAVLESCAVVDLTYRYAASGRGVHNVSFTLQPGSLTVITGRIGAGKTTLLQLLLGLLPADSGEIRWNGQVVDHPAQFFVPPRSAYIPQVPRLFSETLLQNILQGWPDAPGKLAQAIHTAVLEPDIAQLERRLDTPIGPRGVRLSGGQVHRTATARMLVRGPALAVIDDVSSALDVETERILWDRLLAQPNMTLLAVSHRREVLRRADKILVLKDGRLVTNDE